MEKFNKMNISYILNSEESSSSEETLTEESSTIPNIFYAMFKDFSPSGLGRPRRYNLDKLRVPTNNDVIEKLITILDDRNKDEWFTKCNIYGWKNSDDYSYSMEAMKPIYAKIFKGYICDNIPIENCETVLNYLENKYNMKFSLMYILHTREPPNILRRGPMRAPTVATLSCVLSIPQDNIKIDSLGNITFN